MIALQPAPKLRIRMYFAPRIKNSVFFLICIFISAGLSAEILNYDKVLSNLKGIKYYQDKNYEDAEKIFSDNSIQHPGDARLHFNQGNAQYKNGKLEEAEHSYNLALKNKDFADKSLALQNLGNIKFQQKDYKNAITHYRDALIENPDNQAARYNYELAARMLQRQQQQKQQQEQSKGDNQEEKEKEEQQQGQQEQDKQQEEQKERQKREEKESQPQEEMKSEQREAEEKEKEDADKILKALLQKEKEEMKKERQKMNVDKQKRGRYW